MKKMNLKVIVNHAPANPAELLMGWRDLMAVLFTITAAASVTVMDHEVEENILMATFMVLVTLSLAWFPGMLLASFADDMKECMGKTCSTYASAKSVFADGIRTAAWSLFRLPIGAGGISVYLAALLSAAIIIGDIAALFNGDALILSIVAGALLSTSSCLVLGFSYLRVLIRERSLARQLL